MLGFCVGLRTQYESVWRLVRNQSRRSYKISLNDLPDNQAMFRVVAILVAVAVVDHYMLNSQLTGAAFTMSRSVLQYYRIL